ncbi:MAG: porin family protein [Gemmatimonadetes bacterium]|nr:porin family protein [Gemmatimonadota bacterium]
MKPTTLAALLLLIPGALQAQDLADYDYENLAFRGVGLDYGYIWPTRVRATPLFSMRFDLGYLGPAVRIVPTIGYWSSEFRHAELARLANRLARLPVLQQQGVEITAEDLGTVHWSDISLGVDAQYVWTTPLDVLTFVGVNAGLHALNGRGDAIAGTFVEDLLDSTAAGVAFMAGAEYELASRLRVYGEMRYSLVSDVRYPGIRLGAVLMLPSARSSEQSGGK